MITQAFQEVLLRKVLLLCSLRPGKMIQERVYFSCMKDDLHYFLEKDFLTGRLSDHEISIIRYFGELV